MFDMDFNIKGCHVSITPFFAVMLCLILLLDSTGIMLFGLIAVAIHETGHLIFMAITKKHLETVVFQLGGIIIKSSGFSDYNREFLVALGGCLFNFIAFSVLMLLYYINQSQVLLIFAAANLGLMIFNILPVNGLDGMDLIKLSFLKKYSPEKAIKLCNIISTLFLVTCLLASVCAVLYLGLNPTIIIALLYLLILTLISIKQ